jgi:LacI family transcriptional regulator
MNDIPRIRRSRMSDVATAAGVSLATVDRALNGRGVVRKETLDLVLRAAGDLGYILPAAAEPAASTFIFDVVLPGGSNSFLQILAREIETAADARADRLSARLHRVPDFSPPMLVETLATIGPDSNGIAVIAPDHPDVRDALRAFTARGTPVVTLVTDVANVGRVGYVGIDNRASGRLAAQLIGRLLNGRSGSVVLFLGSRSYRGHEEREIGFRDLLNSEFAALKVIDVRDVHDDNERAKAETERLLRSRNDILGIYNVAGGNRGIVAALEQVRRDPRVVFVAHELTEHSRRFLISGFLDIAIDQNPKLEAAEVLDLLYARASGAPSPVREAVRITPFFRENLP